MTARRSASTRRWRSPKRPACAHSYTPANVQAILAGDMKEEMPWKAVAAVDQGSDAAQDRTDLDAPHGARRDALLLNEDARMADGCRRAARSGREAGSRSGVRAEVSESAKRTQGNRSDFEPMIITPLGKRGRQRSKRQEAPAPRPRARTVTRRDRSRRRRAASERAYFRRERCASCSGCGGANVKRVCRRKRRRRPCRVPHGVSARLQTVA
jgi:hypothetical protein